MLKTREDLARDVQVLRTALEDYLEATQGWVPGGDADEEKARKALKSVEADEQQTGMCDIQFLEWIAQRLVHKHGDPENADFICRFRRIILRTLHRQTLLMRMERLKLSVPLEELVVVLNSLVVDAKMLSKDVS